MKPSRNRVFLMLVACLVTATSQVVLAQTGGFGGGSTNPDNGVYNDFAYSANWFGNFTGNIAKNQTAHVVASSIDIAVAPYNPIATITLGYWSSNPAPGFGSGSGTLSVESGTLNVTGTLKVGQEKYGSGSYPGTLIISGGILRVGGDVSAGIPTYNNPSSVSIIGGTLDLGNGGSNHSIVNSTAWANQLTVSFTSGCISNILNGFINTLSGSGMVSNLTGVLTLNLASSSLFSGNIYGSGSGTITKTNSGVLTLAPAGIGTNGTMTLAGLTTTTNIVFNFDLSTPEATNDLIVIGSGGMTVTRFTAISFDVAPTNWGNYRLFGGVIGSANLTNFVLPAAPVGRLYSLSTNVEPGYIALVVARDQPLIDNAYGATGVTADSAWLNGSVLHYAESWPDVTIFWGPADGGTNRGDWYTNIPMGSLDTGPFSSVITNLTPGAPYFYRCYATNTYGEGWAPTTFAFETLSSVTASNGPVTGITQTNAIFCAGLLSGGFGELRVYWGLTDGGTDTTAWQNTNSFGVVQPGTYTTNVTVLAGCPYFYRVYATNGLSEDWADVTSTFMTPVPAVSLSSLPASPIVETGGVATVTATLSAPSVSNITVNFSFGGVAVKDVDYTSSADSVIVVAGTLSADITLSAVDDALQEEDETIVVSILSLQNATNGSPISVSPAITSDDVEVSNGIGASGLAPSSAILNGVLTKGDRAAITVFWGETDGETNVSAWGATNLLGDRIEDMTFSNTITGLLAQKTYYYRCYATNASLLGQDWADTTATFTTRVPVVTLTNVPPGLVYETGGVVAVSATLSAPSIYDVTVNFSFSGVAATNTDYIYSTNRITIPAGMLASNITLTALDDALQEEDETVIVGIASLVNGTNGSPSVVTNTITSDDPKVTNGAGASGITQSNAVLNGILTMGDSATIKICWGPSDGVTNFSAWATTDVLGARSEDISFSNRVSGLTASKTYYYRCYATNSSLLAEAWATNTAVFATTVPSVVINDISVMEGDSNGVFATFAVSVLTPSASNVSVTCTTSNGTATAGVNYVATNAVVTIPAGQWSAPFAVNILGDKQYTNSARVFYVNLSAASRCTIADNKGACTIIDDDASVLLIEWRHKMKITFSGYDKPEILTNFPALVVLQRDASGFAYSEMFSPFGWDLRFANSNSTVLLNHEIERWEVFGKSYAWVQVPELVDSNTCIWAYWGNPGGTNPLPCTTNGATWSQGYTAVWHCAQSSGTTVSNSRPTGVSGTLQNGSWDGSSRIGRGLQVNGGNPGVAVGALGFGGAASRTVSGWVKQSAPSVGARSMFGFSGVTNFDCAVSTSGTDWVLCASSWEGTVTSAKTNSEWYYLSGTYNGNTVAAYMDGVQYTNALLGSLSVTDTFTMGGRGGWAGWLDEIRVSTVARSANWEWASWMTVASNNVFCIMRRGPEGTAFFVR